MIEEFVFPDYAPVYPLTKQVTPFQYRAKLPSWGIEQRKSYSINQISPEWNAVWRVYDEDAEIINEFFANCARYNSSFWWQPPSGPYGKYICKEWSRSVFDAFVSEITATICFVYDSDDLKSINVDVGQISIITPQAELKSGYGVPADTASIALSGSNAELSRTYIAPVSTGNISLVGGDLRLNEPLPDLYFNSVSLLLHMDGSNSSTTFTDNSSNTLTVTANGNAKVSTAQSKFGGASAVFDGNGDYLSISSNAVLAFPGDFTIELWVYQVANSLAHGLVVKRDLGAFGTGTWGIYIGDGTIYFACLDAQAAGYHSFGTIALNTWTHVAVSRNGSTIRMFLNGALNNTVTNSINFTNSWNLHIAAWVGGGGVPTSGWLNGYIDDLRITKGVARYTASFTPPSAAFPNS